MKRKKLWIGTGMGLVLILILGIVFLKRDTEASIPLYEVNRQDIEETVLTTGKVVVCNREEIFARTGGAIQEIRVKLGERVHKGQVLMVIDPAEHERQLEREEAGLAALEAELSKAKAPARPQEIKKAQANLTRADEAYRAAKEKYQRLETLFDEEAVSRENLESAHVVLISGEADYLNAKEDLSLLMAGAAGETVRALEAQVRQAVLAVQQAREDLDNTFITAPVDGVVLALDSERGQYVTAGAALAAVGDTGNLMIKAEVNEADSGFLSTGQKVNITSAAVLNEQYRGEISSIAPIAVSRTEGQGEATKVGIEVVVDGDPGKLKPGFTVDLEITSASVRNAVIVPYESVMETEQGKKVRVVKEGQTEERAVETGIGNELFIEITDGLKEGEKIVKNPLFQSVETGSQEKGNQDD